MVCVCVSVCAALMHAVQEGIPESKNDPEAKRFLLSKMDDLAVVR